MMGRARHGAEWPGPLVVAAGRAAGRGASDVGGRVLLLVAVGVVAMSIVAVGVAGVSQAGTKFYADDPLLDDFDRLDTPNKPAEIELSDLYDRFGHIFVDLGKSPIGSEAQNVNTLDETPNSSWFTNRHASERLPLAELVRGPDRGEPPNTKGAWEVFKSKSQGLTPGFQITDANGDRYVIKLDPVGTPELSSAAEVIATKIFYALGYNVPSNFIARIDPAQFTIKPGTVVKDRFGDSVPLTNERLERLLRRVPRLADGRVRVTASKYIDGVPIGPFRYYGTRSDDPNDVIPHEDRRELRGLRLIAAWLNHDDTRAHNTQDSWVQAADGTHYVRHYLIDFGSTFGSGSVDLQLPNLSYHYWMDLPLIQKNLLGLGLHVPKYRQVKWPSFPEFAAVGRWESVHFDPAEWRNDYPNPAFVRMTARDAFWAAKLLMSLTPEELFALVETGEFSDSKQADYFYYTLLERQRRAGRWGLMGVNPLDAFRLEGGVLQFANLAEVHHYARAGSTQYWARWWELDNSSGQESALGAPLELEETAVALPASGGQDSSHWFLELRSVHPDHPHWAEPVRVFVRVGTTPEVVGIERQSP